jgi:hypothetical protein
MSSACQHEGCNCAYFLRLCPHRGSFHCIFFVRAHLSVQGHGGLGGLLFSRVHFLVLGHGLGSVASFVCALWHLSQLIAVHHPRAGEAISRTQPYKQLGFYLNFRYGTKSENARRE